MAQQPNIRPTKPPRRAPLRVSDADTVTQPVLNVSAPLEAAEHVDFNVVEVEGVHDLADVPEPFVEDDRSVCGASTENFENSRGIVRWSAACGYLSW